MVTRLVLAVVTFLLRREVSKDAELHELRHVAASLMLAAGVKIVQLTLGRVTSTYTRDT
jgi:integrase